jgi:hypothetical protein
MRIAIRAAALLLFLLTLPLAVFGQTTITTHSTTFTSPSTLTNGSFVRVTLAPGPNLVVSDIAGTYTGQFAVMVSRQGNTGPLRTWPSASIANDLTNGATGISANAAGSWTANISGPGYAYLVATALTAGTPSVTFTAGYGGSGSVGGSSGAAGTVTANAGTNLNTSALALETGGNLAAVLTTLGATADAAAGDATATANAHLRQIAKLLGATVAVTQSGSWSITGNVATTAADGANVAIGTTTDAAVGDATGTAIAHLRQIAKQLGTTVAVTQSGTWTIAINSSASTPTNPTVANATSTQILAAGNYKFIEIQNQTPFHIVISLSGATITGLTGSASNSIIDIPPGLEWHTPPNWSPSGAITCYQASGASTNQIHVEAA